MDCAAISITNELCESKREPVYWEKKSSTDCCRTQMGTIIRITHLPMSEGKADKAAMVAWQKKMTDMLVKDPTLSHPSAEDMLELAKLAQDAIVANQSVAPTSVDEERELRQRLFGHHAILDKERSIDAKRPVETSASPTPPSAAPPPPPPVVPVSTCKKCHAALPSSGVCSNYYCQWPRECDLCDNYVQFEWEHSCRACRNRRGED